MSTLVSKVQLIQKLVLSIYSLGLRCQKLIDAPERSHLNTFKHFAAWGL